MLPRLTPELRSKIEALNVSRESIERLERLSDLLQLWQRHINLVSATTIEQIWERHIYDSLQLLPLFPAKCEMIADLGSGGGFPGLVLAAAQTAKVHFYEANGKKVAFLREALRQMAVSGEVHQVRLEQETATPKVPQMQLVTTRAFAPLSTLLGLAKPFFGTETIGLFHKGQDVDAELNEAAKSWHIKYNKHTSLTDSKSVILEVKEFARV